MTRRQAAIVGVVAALFAGRATLAAIHQAGPLTGDLTGRVVERSGGRPVSEAVVTLTGSTPVRRALTGSNGEFDFAGLPAGSYGLRADRPGYLSASAGQHSPMGFGQPLALSDGQRATIELGLWKAGAISGSATTASLPVAPVVGADIHALARTVMGGEWRWTDAGSSMSDDRGQYRIGGLPPGDYLIVARPVQNPETPLLMAMLMANAASAADVMANMASTSRETPDVDARVLISAMTYSGAAATASARSPIVSIAPGAARTDVDLHVPRSRGVRLAGRLTGDTAPTAGLIVRLLAAVPPADARDAANADGQGIEVAASACDAGGRFEFSAVPAGRYTLAMDWMPPLPPQPAAPPQLPGRQAPPSGPLFSRDPAVWARAPIVVGATDIASVDLPARPGMTVEGRVISSGASDSPPPALESTLLRLEPLLSPFVPVATVVAPRMAVDAGGQISSASALPGKYLLRVTAPRGWNAVSAVAGGVDLLDRPIDLSSSISDLVVTLTDRPLGTIAGSIAPAAGPASDVVTVMAFPAQAQLRVDSTPASRRIRILRAPAAGTFSIGSLPPGDYDVVALDGDPPPGWQRAAQLATLEGSAQHVTLALGATEHVTLEVRR